MMRRIDCYWYSSTKDTGESFDQCKIGPRGECPCDLNCKWYISKYKVDDLVYTILQIWAD